MKRTVFIDGSAGTTGLRIADRLAARDDITLLQLPSDLRRNIAARREALNAADIAFLCLPDEAAKEAVALVQNPHTVLIDTSTAHRTAQGWVYAFPELSPNGAQAVAQAKRIAVPGCHASGFIALIAPLVQAKLLSAQVLLTCHSVTGYSGGGKAMIEAYTAPNAPAAYDAPRLYGLGQQHKHLREMQAYSGLEQPPVFCPVVAPFYSGMLVTVGLFAEQLAPGAHRADVIQAYCAAYQDDVVRYVSTMDEDGFIASNALSGSDRMEITVLGNDERLVLAARYDNLGKGASGAAVQAMNLVLGAPPTTGLVL